MSGVFLLVEIDKIEHMFLFSIHSCRMCTYLDPVSHTTVIVLHPPVWMCWRPHLTRPPPRRLLSPQQRDLFFGHHPGELRIEWAALLTGSCPLRQGLGQDGDHRPEAPWKGGVEKKLHQKPHKKESFLFCVAVGSIFSTPPWLEWCTCDFMVSKKGLMIERIPSDVNFWTLYLIPKLHCFFLLAIWGLIWMTLASQTIDIATWSILGWECQFAGNVLPHAAFLLLFKSIVSCYSLQIQPFYSLPPPPSAPLLQFHLFMCSFTVCVCLSVCLSVCVCVSVCGYV